MDEATQKIAREFVIDEAVQTPGGGTLPLLTGLYALSQMAVKNDVQISKEALVAGHDTAGLPIS